MVRSSFCGSDRRIPSAPDPNVQADIAIASRTIAGQALAGHGDNCHVPIQSRRASGAEICELFIWWKRGRGGNGPRFAIKGIFYVISDDSCRARRGCSFF
jgi:hypothetical protein